MSGYGGAFAYLARIVQERSGSVLLQELRPARFSHQLPSGLLVLMNDGDKTLAARILMGDKMAFEAILDRYEKTVFNVTYRMVGNYEDAMDITQAVFVKIYRKIELYNPSFKFFSWLYRMTLNEVINFLHREKVARVAREEKKLGHPASLALSTPEDDIADLERNAQLQRALSALKPDYRVVLILKYFVDLSYEQIGQILQIEVTKVKSRLFTGRQLMRDQLLRQGYVE
jgi:RNA polymerase sigma-70 factor (ECF subfamily)